MAEVVSFIQVGYNYNYIGSFSGVRGSTQVNTDRLSNWGAGCVGETHFVLYRSQINIQYTINKLFGFL